MEYLCRNPAEMYYLVFTEAGKNNNMCQCDISS